MFTISDVDLTFMDGEPLLPQFGQIVSGTYGPTNYGGGDTFDPPAPPDPYGSALSVFSGTSGNGTWSLFVMDDVGGDLGSLAGGWSMTVTQLPPPPPITYQGRLQDDGVPLNDTADFEFSLQDAGGGGNEIAFATADAVQVTDGLFTVELQFGGLAFSGEDRWVEISVRTPAGSGDFTTLSPTQRITPAPEAIHARSATTADTADNALTADAATTADHALTADAATTAEIAQAAFALDAPDGSPIDAVFVDLGGNVGIGTTGPSATLDVVGTTELNGTLDAFGDVRLRDLGADVAFLQARDESDPGDIALQIRTQNAGANVDAVRIDKDGNVGIGTTSPSEKLHVVGNICVTGAYLTCSDGRFKKNVEGLSDSLERIAKLRGVRFDWRREAFPDHEFSAERQIGFIGQEIREVIPEAVSKGSDGYYSVDYGRVTPLLVEAVKELHATVKDREVQIHLQQLQADSQRAEIGDLCCEIDNLTARLKRLEALVAANAGAGNGGAR